MRPPKRPPGNPIRKPLEGGFLPYGIRSSLPSLMPRKGHVGRMEVPSHPPYGRHVIKNINHVSNEKHLYSFRIQKMWSAVCGHGPEGGWPRGTAPCMGAWDISIYGAGAHQGEEHVGDHRLAERGGTQYTNARGPRQAVSRGGG